MLTWDDNLVYYTMSVFRFTLGVGVGGLYPLSAVACAESTIIGESRETRTALAFTWQAAGAVLAPLVAYLLLHAACNSLIMWRLFLAVGAVPAAVVLRLVSSSAESAEYRAAVRNGGQPPLYAQLTILD